MKAKSNTIKDGQFYRQGDEIWELGSWVATEVYGNTRHYKGLSADVQKLPHYVGTGSTAECMDTGVIYKYEKSTDRWYLSNTGGEGSGKDGFSPIAEVKREDGKTTITITDRYGTTTAEIHDNNIAFEFKQDIPQKVWTITHGLNNQYPNVICINENGDKIFGEIDYYSQNVTIVRFDKAVTGKAIIK